MKIAYILPYLQKPAGWRSHACAMIEAIRQEVEPVLFVAAEDLAIARDLFPGLPILPLPTTQQASFSSWRGWLALASCYRAVRRGDFPSVDLVHSLEAYPTGLVGSWLAGKLNCPHVITTHGTYGVIWHQHRLDRLVYRLVLRRTRLVCPVSHGTAALMQQYFGPALARTRVHPILNGNNFYQQVPRQAVMERAAPPVPTLLSVGDVKPRKGQHLSLAAFAQVKARHPDARYRIVGHFKGDAYYQGLVQWIADHHLEGVEFTGRVSEAELRRHYHEASLFVLTPQPDGLRFEGFGLVYLEAGAYGLPVVATETGGVADAVKDGVTGYLAPPGDEAGVARAILRLLANPDMARSMGRANRRWAETLTWERNAYEQVRAYKALLESRPS